MKIENINGDINNNIISKKEIISDNNIDNKITDDNKIKKIRKKSLRKKYKQELISKIKTEEELLNKKLLIRKKAKKI